MLDDRNINLVEEGIDVALRMGPLSDSSLTARKIADCRRVVLGSPAYFARHGEPCCRPIWISIKALSTTSAAAPPGPSPKAANSRHKP
jgi:DNA-binding transcriptional LysR family regulator